MTDPINKIYLMLGEIKSDQATMKEDISEIKTSVTDYQTTKNKIVGACIIISAGVGGAFSTLLNKIGLSN